MAIDNSFISKQIQAKEHFYAVYCAYTNMPLLVCDQESYNDQVWMFDTVEALQRFAKPYTEKKVLLQGREVQQKDFLKFFSSLFSMGVNELVFVADDDSTMTIELNKLVREPDYSKMPEQQRPILNPNLQLTGIYFMQEAGRPVKLEEKENLQELEEELSANLIKGRYMVAVELEEGEGTVAEKLRNKQYRIPILKDKNENVFQPIFTDPLEFEKFTRGRKLGAIAVPFDKLAPMLVKEASAFMLNPQGIHIVMNKELLEKLPKRFQ